MLTAKLCNRSSPNEGLRSPHSSCRQCKAAMEWQGTELVLRALLHPSLPENFPGHWNCTYPLKDVPSDNNPAWWPRAGRQLNSYQFPEHSGKISDQPKWSFAAMDLEGWDIHKYRNLSNIPQQRSWPQSACCRDRWLCVAFPPDTSASSGAGLSPQHLCPLLLSSLWFSFEAKEKKNSMERAGKGNENYFNGTRKAVSTYFWGEHRIVAKT